MPARALSNHLCPGTSGQPSLRPFCNTHSLSFMLYFGACLSWGLLYLQYVKSIRNRRYNWRGTTKERGTSEERKKRTGVSEFHYGGPLSPLIYFTGTSFVIIAKRIFRC